MSGETALWASVVKQAIVDMDDRSSNMRRSAARWVFNGEQRIGGFGWICDSLGLDMRKLQALCQTRHGRAKLLQRASNQWTKKWEERAARRAA